MAKIDLEKVLIALLDSSFNKQFDDKVKDALKEQGLEYKDGEIVETQKSKFKVGDWVVLKNGGYFSSGSKTVRIKDIIGKEVWFETDTWLFEDEIRHWTIQDAKDGDVLRLGCITAIFKEYIGQEKCICYCSISEDGDFEIPIEEVGDNIYGCTNTTPATKSQRNTLFTKMKEAGYEWDAKKKELKKIEAEKTSFANRQLYNRAILAILSNYVEKYPDIRFGQMLFNLDIKPHFDEESREAYWNLNETINKQNHE